MTLLGIWLIIACPPALPAAQLPFTASAHDSETSRLLYSVPLQWSRSPGAELEHFGPV